MELEELNELLDKVTELSDAHLETSLNNAIKKFRNYSRTHEETKKFIHELRDWAVYVSGASSFVMTLFGAMIGEGRSYPPPKDEDFTAWINSF